MRRAVVAVLLLSACATADKRTFTNVGDGSGSGNPDGGVLQRPDGEMHEQVDAFELADAPPNVMQKTLDQTPTDDTILANNSAACPAATAGTGENHYIRVFDLNAEGITGAFTVSSVSFQVEEALSISSADGSQTVTVNVGTYTGAFGGTKLDNTLSQISTAAGVTVPEVDEASTATGTIPGAVINVPILASIPAGSKVYVEVVSPDGDNDHELYMGTNKSAETEPGYVNAPDCTTAPTAFKTLTSDGRAASVLMTVTGTY